MNTKLIGIGAVAILCGVAMNPVMAKTDGEKAATSAAVRVVRIGVGTAVGGTAGKFIAGGPVGAAVGTFITPSETACYKGEQCAKWGTVVNPKPAAGGNSSGGGKAGGARGGKN